MKDPFSIPTRDDSRMAAIIAATTTVPPIGQTSPWKKASSTSRKRHPRREPLPRPRVGHPGSIRQRQFPSFRHRQPSPGQQHRASNAAAGYPTKFPARLAGGRQVQRRPHVLGDVAQDLLPFPPSPKDGSQLAFHAFGFPLGVLRETVGKPRPPEEEVPVGREQGRKGFQPSEPSPGRASGRACRPNERLPGAGHRPAANQDGLCPDGPVAPRDPHGRCRGRCPARILPYAPDIARASGTPRTLPKTASIKHFDLRTRQERAMPDLSTSLATARLAAMNSRRHNGFPLCTRVRTTGIVTSRPEAAGDVGKPGPSCGSYHGNPCFGLPGRRALILAHSGQRGGTFRGCPPPPVPARRPCGAGSASGSGMACRHPGGVGPEPCGARTPGFPGCARTRRQTAPASPLHAANWFHGEVSGPCTTVAPASCSGSEHEHRVVAKVVRGVPFPRTRGDGVIQAK
jgi:hypothetical protein